jgi:hypothetical protein
LGYRLIQSPTETPENGVPDAAVKVYGSEPDTVPPVDVTVAASVLVVPEFILLPVV